MSAEEPANPVEDSKARARGVLDVIAGHMNTARAAAEQSQADPNAWHAAAERHLLEHPDACREVYRQLWAEYVRQELASKRTIKSIRLAEKQPVDCPSDPLFAIVNKVILKLEGGSNIRIVEDILDACEEGTLDCQPKKK